MKNNKIKIILAGTLVAATLFSGCGQRFIITTGMSGNAVFKVNNESCQLKEAKVYLMTLQNEYKDYYGIDIWSVTATKSGSEASASGDAGSSYDSLKTYIKNKTMSRLQNVICMYKLAEERDITVTDIESSKIKQAATAYYESLSDEERSYLGVAESDIETYYTQYLMANKLYNELIGNDNLQVSDSDARVMSAQIIYTASADKAKSIEDALSSGNDFAAVASTYSEYESVAVNIKKGDMRSAVESAAFKLADGETSSCIEADGGYYYIKCISRMDEQLTEDNRQEIIAAKTEESFDTIYQDYIKGLYIDVNDDLWNSIDIDDSSNVTSKSFFTTYNEYLGE